MKNGKPKFLQNSKKSKSFFNVFLSLRHDAIDTGELLGVRKRTGQYDNGNETNFRSELSFELVKLGLDPILKSWRRGVMLIAVFSFKQLLDHLLVKM